MLSRASPHLAPIFRTRQQQKEWLPSALYVSRPIKRFVAYVQTLHGLVAAGLSRSADETHEVQGAQTARRSACVSVEKDRRGDTNAMRAVSREPAGKLSCCCYISIPGAELVFGCDLACDRGRAARGRMGFAEGCRDINQCFFSCAVWPCCAPRAKAEAAKKQAAKDKKAKQKQEVCVLPGCVSLDFRTDFRFPDRLVW